MRYDRVVAKVSGTGGWAVGGIEMLGTKAIEPSGRVFPSDHFGLIARFTKEAATVER